MREINAKTVQSTALVAVVLLGSLLPVNAIGSHLGHHVWLSIIIAVLPAPLMVWLYSCLSDSGQRRLKMLLAAVLLLLSAYYVLLMLSFWSAFEMRNTPVLVYALTFACFTFFSARLGRRAIERTASIVVFVFVVAVIGDTLLLMPDYHPRRLLPLAGADWADVLITAGYYAALIYGMLPLTLGLFSEAGQGKSKALRRGMGLGIGYCIICIGRNALLFGDTLRLEGYPTVRALRMMQWDAAVSRLELLGALAVLTVLLVYVVLLCRQLTDWLAAALRRKTDDKLLAAVCAALYGSSYLGYVLLANPDTDGVRNAVALLSLLGLLLACRIGMPAAGCRKVGRGKAGKGRWAQNK
ncbi:MAG: GerAB/ArcD/ProY family transporter [Firmicutes bacterium]|nr:GerAB/ArcD/ProY family transporter [Bacillota bacterium]